MNSRAVDTIVLGAGGAGLMCAAHAAACGARVVIVDHAPEPGKKILISGGGRCNFTNLDVRPERYLSKNPHFCKSALSRYEPAEFIDLVDRHGITWHEKTLGQLFCDGSARQIVDMLLQECRRGGADLHLKQQVGDISHSDGRFQVKLIDRTYTSHSLVVATGGLSIPKMGATGFAYDIARQFGLKIVEPRPALVPLTLGGSEVLFRELSGVATNVVAQCGGTKFREAALFTHKGLSGPAILQISSYWQPRSNIEIDFMPDQDEAFLVEQKKMRPGLKLPGSIGTAIPDRLASILADRLIDGDPGLDRSLSNISDAQLRIWGQTLKNWRFHPDGTEGFAKAEVTLGGVSTDGLSSKTMEAQSVSGLYFIGEAVDVTGWLGGYNFQWAWASGVAAARAIRERNRDS